MAENNNKQNEIHELRITGISSKTMNEISNIAQNAGVTMSNLLRPIITKIPDSYPERMRMPPKKD